MTGWRIGWMLVPRRLRRAVEVLTGNFTICPPALAQHAALAAFSESSYDELDGHVRSYATNRALLLDGLPQLGVTRLAPADGAFYVHADIGHLTDDSLAWCHETLEPGRRGPRARRRLRHPRRRTGGAAQLRRVAVGRRDRAGAARGRPAALTGRPPSPV